MHYYQFNIADYRKDTAHLCIVEHGIYRQLIDWYFLDESPIPLETQVVTRRLSIGSDWLHYLENVLSDFFIKTENGYFHKRVELELEKYRTQFAKNRDNGKLGGRPKKTQVVSKQKPKKTQVVLENNHMGTQNNPSAPLTNNQQPLNISTSLRSVDMPRPDYVSADTWDGFIEVRHGLKAKNTLPAINALINQLERLRASGQDPEAVVLQSIRSSWKDLYPVNGQQRPQKQSRHSGFDKVDYAEGVNADGSF